MYNGWKYILYKGHNTRLTFKIKISQRKAQQQLSVMYSNWNISIRTPIKFLSH